MSGGVRASRVLGAARLVGRSSLPVRRNCLAVSAFTRAQLPPSTSVSVELVRKFSAEAAVEGRHFGDINYCQAQPQLQL